MKKLKVLFISILLLFSSFTALSQVSAIGTLSVPTNSVFFGRNLPQGTLIFDQNTKKVYFLIAPAISVQTLLTSQHIVIPDSLLLNDSLSSLRVKINNNYLSISSNLALINANTSNIIINASNINSNTSDITTNATNIQKNADSLAIHLDTLQVHNTRILANKLTIATKQPQLNGTGFVKASGTTISYDNSTYLTGNQSITLSGDVTGTGSTAITTTLKASGVTAGTYNNITVNAKGIATFGSNTSYLTTETDPVFLASPANNITTTDITNLGNLSGTNTGDQTLSGLGGVATNTAITAGTHTKITYDAKGLVTAGVNATTADIASSTDKRYVTDAELTVIGNTSGTNTGDQNISGITTNATNIQKNVDSLAVHLSTMQSLNINIQVNAGDIATNTTNVQKNTDSIAALRADVNSLGSSKVERFTAIGGQTKFGLSSDLTLGNLVFVNGNLADVSTYSGVGTDTLTFNTPLSLYDHVTAFYAYGSSTSIYWYGVEWDTTVADPALTRIGNVEYQATLPIQSRMVRAVVNDNGTINYYLDPNNSNYKADGTPADLTGASGQVMVIIPTHWYRFEKIGTIRKVELSTVALPGFTEVPEYAVGAYEAYYNTTTGKLESRSGVMPTTNKTRANFRAYAAARGANWHQLDYTNYLDIFYLYLTEYATFDIQSVIPGATNANGTDWSNYNGYNSVIATGVSNTYGNYSGSVPFSLTNFVGGTGTLNSQVADYRGIENIYGHIWQFIDGINVDYVSTTQANVYIDADPSTFADDTQTGYTLLGTSPNANGWIRSLIDGSWIPATDVGASSSTYMTDYHYVSITQTGVWRVALAGGSFSNGTNAGLLDSNFNISSGSVSASVGARLCLKIK